MKQWRVRAGRGVLRKQAENAVDDNTDRTAEREMWFCWGRELRRVRASWGGTGPHWHNKARALERWRASRRVAQLARFSRA